MEKDILIVPNPSYLPSNKSHKESIETLCSSYTLVIFLQFGDERYYVSEKYEKPSNGKFVQYDYDTLDKCLSELEGYLRSYGVSMLSRHHLGKAPLPFVVSGSILQLPEGVSLDFYGRDKQVKKELETA